ncbi:Ger(x)C family spore germination protein [Rummeliibacillus pycnus]|uniref:Ger(x)C family spore germination protein n=1 Tax=Rummeliibacillus pycnus TaxID=101070 RepID=UPI000C9A94DC|nr:Ger(x)C family spore germination protein [Rummeliibacillus pycnus]
MIRSSVFISIFFSILFLSGCSQDKSKVPLEDVAMVGVMAFDYIEENKTKLTVVIPQYSPEAKKNIQTISVTTDIVSNGIMKIGKLSDKKVALNQLRVVLINDDFARQAKVRDIIEYLYRNPQVGNKVYIAVVKGSGEEILKGQYPDKQSVIYYLKDLLHPSVTTAFNPNTDIHSFMYTSTNPVFDPILPMLIKKDSKIDIENIALFRNGHLFETISPNEALIIQALQGKKNLSPLYLKLNNRDTEEKIMLDLIKSKVKIKSNKNMNSPRLTITLKIEGILSEYKGKLKNKLENRQNLTILEDEVNKEVETDIKQFLAKLKEMKIDPIGLSENFRMYHNGKWTKEMTKQTISKLNVDVHVETSILSTGTLK